MSRSEWSPATMMGRRLPGRGRYDRCDKDKSACPVDRASTPCPRLAGIVFPMRRHGLVHQILQPAVALPRGGRSVVLAAASTRRPHADRKSLHVAIRHALVRSQRRAARTRGHSGARLRRDRPRACRRPVGLCHRPHGCARARLPHRFATSLNASALKPEKPAAMAGLSFSTSTLRIRQINFRSLSTLRTMRTRFGPSASDCISMFRAIMVRLPSRSSQPTHQPMSGFLSVNQPVLPCST